MNKEIEKINASSYNKAALEYVKIFSKNPNYLIVLNKIINKLPKNSKILDAGCGAGIPVSKFLSKRFKVIGIDISSMMLKLAKKNVPSAKFKRISLTKIKFKPQTFDLICNFFSLFHVKKEKIPRVLKRFYKSLRNNGYLIIALGESKKGKEEFLNFLGEKIYYASTPKEKLEKMLKKLGFKLIFSKYLYFRYFRKEKRMEKELFIIAKK